MINWIIGGVAVFVLAVGGFFVAQTGNGTEDAIMEKEKAAMEKEAMMQAEKAAMAEKEAMMQKETMEKETMKKEDSSMMEKKEAMMKDEGAMMEKPDGEMMTKTGSYEAYAPEKLAKAEQGDVVLFFRAAWCPTCKALDADIKANMSKIPAGVTILDVNYDSSAALKQKYGVTYQHTLVQVDAQGNQITKWSGGLTLAEFLKNVK